MGLHELHELMKDVEYSLWRRPLYRDQGYDIIVLGTGEKSPVSFFV